MNNCDDDVRRTLKNLPDGLVGTYQSCLERIERAENKDHYNIVMKAFRWVNEAKRPLTSRELREIVSFQGDDMFLQEGMILNCCVTQYCANLLIIDAVQNVRFAHSSVKQFLSSPEALGDKFTAYHLSSDDELSCGDFCLAYLYGFFARKQVTIR